MTGKIVPTRTPKACMSCKNWLGDLETSTVHKCTIKCENTAYHEMCENHEFRE